MPLDQLDRPPSSHRLPLLAAVRAAVGDTRPTDLVVADVAAAVVAASNGLLRWLPVVSSPPRRVTSEIVHAESGFSIVSLTLPPGQGTTVHDHLTWCVVAVVVGRELETTYRHHDDRLEVVSREHHEPGEVSTLVPPGDIHRVTNDTDAPVTSLHVYGLDLRTPGSSVRRVYDLPDTTVTTEENS